MHRHENKRLDLSTKVARTEGHTPRCVSAADMPVGAREIPSSTPLDDSDFPLAARQCGVDSPKDCEACQ